MSEENVEIVRRQNDAFNRADLAQILELTDPDFAWWDRVDDPGATVHRGHDGIAQALAELADSVVELRVEAEDFIDAGESVVVPVRVVGRGRLSGAPFEDREVQVFTLRDGMIVELREYRDVDEALRAVGLSR